LLYVVDARMPTEKIHGYQVIKMAEAFVKHGATIRLVLPRRKNYIEESIENFYNLKNPLDIKYIPNYFSFLENLSERIYFPIHRVCFILHAWLYCLFLKQTVFSRNIMVCFLLGLLGQPVIYEDHEPKTGFKWLYKLFLRVINKKVIVAVNIEELYKKFGIKKETYILAPNGADIEEFNRVPADKSIWQREFNIASHEKIVLYVGHFYKWKGVETLLESAPDIQGKVVLIGGIPQDQSKIKQIADKKGLKNVHIHSFLPHDKIIKYIKSADILVLPNTAKEERSAKYTTPIKMFEYMAAGAPIVASDIPSFSPYLKHNNNAYLCQPDDPKDLALKINLVLSDSELSDQLNKQAYIDVQNYTWDKRVEKIINFINK